MNTNANQAAYPVSAEVEREFGINGWGSIGLTKREAFALAAMQALLSRDTAKPRDASSEAMDEFVRLGATYALKHADALLAALQGEAPNE
jgi:hypothetical protein